MDTTNIIRTAALALVLLAAPAGADHHPEHAPEAAQAAAAPAPETTDGDTAPEPAAAESAPAPAMPASEGTVARAAFALDMVDREPGEVVTQLSNDHDRVFFFTELHRFQGQELVHRWEFGGEVMAEVPFGIDGPRWRVYSSKALDPAWLGTWTVSVVDAGGNVVDRQSFDFVAAPEPVASSEDAAASQPGPAALAE